MVKRKVPDPIGFIQKCQTDFFSLAFPISSAVLLFFCGIKKKGWLFEYVRHYFYYIEKYNTHTGDKNDRYNKRTRTP